jgi:hypothetical protein
MHIIDINLVGVLYTFKLAVHYFRRCPQDPQRDRCFIFIGSIAGIVDNLVSICPRLFFGLSTDEPNREAGSIRRQNLVFVVLCGLSGDTRIIKASESPTLHHSELSSRACRVAWMLNEISQLRPHSHSVGRDL